MPSYVLAHVFIIFRQAKTGSPDVLGSNGIDLRQRLQREQREHAEALTQLTMQQQATALEATLKQLRD